CDVAINLGTELGLGSAVAATGDEANFMNTDLPEGNISKSVGAARSTTTRVTGGLLENNPTRTPFIPPRRTAILRNSFAGTKLLKSNAIRSGPATTRATGVAGLEIAISSSTCLLLPSSETRRTDGCCAIAGKAHNQSAIIDPVFVNSPCNWDSS